MNKHLSMILAGAIGALVAAGGMAVAQSSTTTTTSTTVTPSSDVTPPYAQSGTYYNTPDTPRGTTTEVTPVAPSATNDRNLGANGSTTAPAPAAAPYTSSTTSTYDSSSSTYNGAPNDSINQRAARADRN